MSQKIFDSVKMTQPGRSTFDHSHDVKMSMKFGNLYPTLCKAMMPGDKWSIGCESMIRFAPLISPVMHRIDCTMHYFAIPYRLLWDNFFKWYKGEKNPLTELPYEFPFITLKGDGSNYTPLLDYLGFPTPLATPGATDEKVSAIPVAAYNLVYNEYYRDQNLSNERDYKLIDGNNDLQIAKDICARSWMHDYFTACLPFAQKGDPVEIPMQGIVEVNPDYPNNSPRLRNRNTGALVPNAATIESDANADLFATNPAPQDIIIDPDGSLVVNKGSATLNDLRIAMRVQEWLEKSARGGTRDNEFIRSQYGVKTSDARLQRPEYITGIKTPVTISEVLNTTGTSDAPQGTMAGHGISVINGRYGSYYAEEPTILLGIMNVQPTTAYQQGIDREWLKINEPTELLFPVFGNLGEQDVYNKELYAYTSQGDRTFGYIPRYAEYKYSNNRVAGDFKTTLNFWHMGRVFDTLPALNEAFINAEPTTRIFAVEDGTDYLWAHVYHKLSASRLLPFFGTPTF